MGAIAFTRLGSLIFEGSKIYGSPALKELFEGMRVTAEDYAPTEEAARANRAVRAWGGRVVLTESGDTPVTGRVY
jgi:hypothetical protein